MINSFILLSSIYCVILYITNFIIRYILFMYLL
nr:MAG TPA: hypothetical protein [Caudoviricetes sp.]